MRNKLMTMVNRHSNRFLLWLALSLLPACAVAQHGHAVLSPSVTFPQDDAVLLEAPEMLTMSFRVDVHLLKLALFTDGGDPINLGFTYDPSRTNHNFVFRLPELPPAAFYVAEWSVVDTSRRFLTGAFRFAFGPGAIPPSETIAASYKDVSEERLPATGAYVRTLD